MTNSQDIFKLLQGWDTFRELSDTILMDIARLSEVTTFLPGDIVVTQGGKVDSLYILAEGNLLVLVDGQAVNSVNQAGDLIGEIAWFTGNPASATVKAISQSTAVRLIFNRMQSLSDSAKSAIDNSMQIHLPHIFIKRLIQTNDKAKQVEATFEKLRATEEKLRLANEDLGYQLQSKMAAYRTAASQALSIINKGLDNKINYQSYFCNEYISFDSFKNYRSELHEINVQLSALLEPIVKAEQKISSHYEVVTSGLNPKILGALKSVTSSLNIELSTSDLRCHDCTRGIVIIGDDCTFDEISALANTGYPMLFFTLGHHSSPLQGQINHFISSSTENRNNLIKTITVAINKLLFNANWGLDKYLSWGSPVYEIPISSSDARTHKIMESISHFKSMGIRSSILDRIQLVLEELLMNAIFDAPTDESGNHYYNHLARQQLVTLPENKPIKIHLSSDGLIAGLSVIDMFGSLTPEIILKYLDGVRKGQDLSQENKGGAGKGLYMIVANSDLTVFNITPNRQTEVICLFDLNKKPVDPEDEKNIILNFHFYYG